MNRSIMVALLAVAFAAMPACIGAEGPADQEATTNAPDGSAADTSQEIGGFGRIGWPQAAVITARVATEASSSVMHSRSVWLPAAFCIAFKNEMNAIFLRQPYTGLGAGVFST